MGSLTIYTGPMKSGKTSNLIKAYKHFKSNGKSVIMVKPSIDDRFAFDKVVTRDNEEIDAYNINFLADILNISNEYDVICIDEFQLLAGDICTIKNLLDAGKDIFVAGLNLTAEKKPFGLMGDLMCFAENIHILKGFCDMCGSSDGIFTKCTVAKTDDILVGEDMYKCVCASCYNSDFGE